MAERTGIDVTYLYDDYDRRQFLRATALSLALALRCVSCSLFYGVGSALLAATSIPFVGSLLRCVSLIARTTPPLLQIYVVTFGIGAVLAARWHVHPHVFWIVVGSLSLYTGGGIMRTLEDAARHERMHSPTFA